MDEFLERAIQPADDILRTSGVAKTQKVIERKYTADLLDVVMKSFQNHNA